MCTISYTTSITANAAGYSLSTFTYLTQQFNIYSANMLQIGTYTVTVTGTVDLYPTRSASTTFVITITDPCLATTINSAALSPMTTSVLVATGAITQ
jgi:hypothetical protein